MFASQLTKPTKRAAPEDASSKSSTLWRAAASQPAASSTPAPWKRVKTEPLETPLTQPTTAPYKPMLGAWFGAARAAAAASQQVAMASSQQHAPSALARVKMEATTTSLSQDSEDDKPLARVAAARGQQQQQQRLIQKQQQEHVKPRDWKQQKELQRMHTKTTPPQANPAGFTTAREAARHTEATPATNEKTRAVTATRVASGEDERVFQLSSKRRVTVRRWKTAVLVDIREYYDDNGVAKPGKKGISLAKDQWNMLMRMAHVIDEAVELVEGDRVDGHSLHHVKERIPVNEDRTIAFTLSSKRRITVRFFRSAVLIDLREYYEQGSEMKPGKKGISLSKEQWRSLQQTEPDIVRAIEEV